MNSFLEKNKYVVDRNVIDENMLNVFKTYFYIKFFIAKDSASKYSMSVIEQDKDVVLPFSVFDYADPITESLLLNLLPRVKEVTDISTLEPTYSFVRFYEKGQWLEPHSDRPSCEYSVTLPLMSYDTTSWSIFVENNEVDLDLGDMVIYKGCEATHWRNPFEGEFQVQAHLHYVDASKPENKDYILDGRPLLGMKR